MTNEMRDIMRQWRPVKLDSIVSGYVEAALWSSTPHPTEEQEVGGITLPEDFLGFDYAPDFIPAMRSRVADTLSKLENRRLFRAYCDAFPSVIASEVYNHFGHDLWLTENGHGVGFWDRDYLECFPECSNGETLGDRLTQSVQYREAYLYLTDDKLVSID